MQVLRRADYTQVRWKNGAGTSLEVATGGVPGAAFDWRVSFAHVEQPGRFSDYSGYQRVTVLVAGAGFSLRSPGSADLHFGQLGQWHAYAGSIPYSCELHAGPCWDLNLIARQASGASMTVVVVAAGGLSLEGAPASRYLLPLVEPVVVHSGDASACLEPWDAAVIAPGESCRLFAGGVAQHCSVAIAVIPA